MSATVDKTVNTTQEIMHSKDCCEKWGKKDAVRVTYGDSVTGDTPLIIRQGGSVTVKRIDELVSDWKPHGEKQIGFIEAEVWSDSTKGFTPIRQVTRHKTEKDIFRVNTTSGIVDVTSDHSLLDWDANPVKPRNVQVGDHLLVTPCRPKIDERSARKIWLDSYPSNDTKKNQLIRELVGAFPKWEDGMVKSVDNMGHTDDFVYDLTTNNHHFHVGPGNLVVHNTDADKVSVISDISVKYSGNDIVSSSASIINLPYLDIFKYVFVKLSINSSFFVITKLSNSFNVSFSDINLSIIS
jgi:hypothetical protein